MTMKHLPTPNPESEARVRALLARIRSAVVRPSALPETRVAKSIRLAREKQQRSQR